jgi:hypothetical protein
MKILHVFDTVGIGSITAKFMRRYYPDVQIDIVTRRTPVFDRWHITRFYGYAETVDLTPWRFGLKMLFKSRGYDLVHVDGFDKLVPWIKLLFNVPVLLHYHGTDIRGLWKRKRKYWRFADKILYSTLDLESLDMPGQAVYMPAVIDTELFTPQLECLKKPSSGLTLSYRADDLAGKLAFERDLHLTVQPRNMSYKDMPTLLSRYEYYVEVKRTVEGWRLGKKDSVSCTALQALASGLKVVKWNGETISQFPEEHAPENVCGKLYGIYKELTD